MWSARVTSVDLVDSFQFRETLEGMTKRVAIYARVLTDGQTVENQLRELHAVADVGFERRPEPGRIQSLTSYPWLPCLSS